MPLLFAWADVGFPMSAFFHLPGRAKFYTTARRKDLRIDEE
jgi:hypothetical protein